MFRNLATIRLARQTYLQMSDDPEIDVGVSERWLQLNRLRVALSKEDTDVSTPVSQPFARRARTHRLVGRAAP